MRERAIEGPRVFLALLTPADVDQRYLSWFDDEEHVKFYSGSGRAFTREAVVS